MKVWLVVMAVVLASRGLALAADPRYPDWPCNQIKVPEMSVAAVWAGPPIDDVESAGSRTRRSEISSRNSPRGAPRSKMRKQSSRIPSPATQQSDSVRPR